MAEEKKKRWRPSLTEYRALESEIAELKDCLHRCNKSEESLESQIEGTSQLVAECDAWREKYRTLDGYYQELKKSYDALHGDVIPGVDYRKLKSDYNKLENEHGFLKKDYDTLGKLYDELVEKYHEACSENERLVKRGFWSRLLNK